jgi:hypothetical protein
MCSGVCVVNNAKKHNGFGEFARCFRFGIIWKFFALNFVENSLSKRFLGVFDAVKPLFVTCLAIFGRLRTENDKFLCLLQTELSNKKIMMSIKEWKIFEYKFFLFWK